MTLRPAGTADAAAMARILVRTWRERYPGLVDQDVLDGLDEAGFARYFEEALAPGSGHGALIAGEEPAGFIHYGPDDEDAGRGHIFSFYVLPEHAGRGMGRELMAGALTALAEQGFPAVTLWVFADNAATVRIYERAGFRPDGAERVEEAYRLRERRLALDLIPGSVLLATRGGAVVADEAERLAPDTIFDLGSITKVAVTTALAMVLHERGELDLGAPAARWLPALDERITLTHLLTHRAGLWEWWPVYFGASDPSAAIDFVCSLELRYPVGAARHYSDLGFMLLGEIVRRIAGEELDTLARRLIFAPLGMKDTGYRPAPGLRERIAPTSYGDAYERRMVATGEPYPVGADPAAFGGWREHVLVGEANDGNAHHAFGGVAGHAGLFSTAPDLVAFGQALLDGGGVWSKATIERFSAEAFDPGQALGFWTRRPGFGHGGFPGTELLVDPARALVVVLLTNRLHTPLRPKPVTALWEQVLARVGADGGG